MRDVAPSHLSVSPGLSLVRAMSQNLPRSQTPRPSGRAGVAPLRSGTDSGPASLRVRPAAGHAHGGSAQRARGRLRPSALVHKFGDVEETEDADRRARADRVEPAALKASGMEDRDEPAAQKRPKYRIKTSLRRKNVRNGGLR